MNYSDAMEFIGGFSKSGAPVKDLSRAQQLMDSLGNPEKQLRFVHIAGTNGKGTTLEFVSEVLMDAGYTTGQFTSPFILRYNDRIRINGREIPDDDLARICGRVAENVGERRDFSQFEITMAIAMLFYLENNCDIVVLEAGIGGLLDCTNIIPAPEVAVITSVSLDHTAILGDSVEKIAFQKAGIIKPGSDVVCGCSVPPEALKVIREACGKCGAKLNIAENEFYASFDEQGLKLISGTVPFRLKMNSLPAWSNHRTALEVCLRLQMRGFDITLDNIVDGTERAMVIGRTEFIPGEPGVLLDGGHNPEGVDGLAESVQFYTNGQMPVFAVTGMISTKDFGYCIRRIAGFSRKVLTVDDFAPNAVDAGELAAVAGDNAEAVGSLAEAYKQARSLAGECGGMVVVCGSLYLVSEFAGSDLYRGVGK